MLNVRFKSKIMKTEDIFSMRFEKERLYNLNHRHYQSDNEKLSESERMLMFPLKFRNAFRQRAIYKHKFMRNRKALCTALHISQFFTTSLDDHSDLRRKKYGIYYAVICQFKLFYYEVSYILFYFSRLEIRCASDRRLTSEEF